MSRRLREHIWPQGPYLSAETSIAVRFSEVDAMNVVWHGNYAIYFEMGREFLGSQVGLSFDLFKKNGLYLPVYHQCSEFYGSLHYGETFFLETRLYRQEKPLIETTSHIRHQQTGELLALGHTCQLLTDLTGRPLLTIPDFLREFYHDRF